MKRILLDKEAFEKLVFGEIVEIGDVKIMLQDIGFTTMHNIITNKMVDFMRKKIAKEEKEDI